MASKKHVFSVLEKKAFIDIIKKFSSIIENKNTDGSSSRAKNLAWDSITNEYNASPHVTTQVTSKQLRRLWMNLKQRQREALTKERQHCLATGGGPSTSSAIIDPDVLEVAPTLIVGVDDAIDSDTITESAGRTFDMVSINEMMEQGCQPASSLETTPQTPLLPPVTTTPAPRTPLLPPVTTTPSPPTPLLHPITTTPAPPPILITPTPPPTISANRPSTSTSIQRQKNTILEKEYFDRLRRADELHILEKELLRHQIREAKARAELAEAELAELLLQQQRTTGAEQRNQEDMEFT